MLTKWRWCLPWSHLDWKPQQETIFCIAEHWSQRVTLWCFDLFTLGSVGKESRNDKLLSMPRELSSFSWQGFLNNEWQLPWIVTQQKCDLLLHIAKPSPDKSPPYTRQLDLTGSGGDCSLNRHGLVTQLWETEIHLPLKPTSGKRAILWHM